MKQFKLNVASREGIGRSASRRLRASGKIPAILYGKHTEPRALALDVPEFSRLIKEIAGSAALVELNAGGDEPMLSFIQEIQRDPMTDRFVHVDLHEISANEKMEIDITVHLTGDAYGVRIESGVLEIASHRVLIRCLPKDLPSFIEVDVSELRVGQTLHVSDLPEIPGVEYRDEPDRAVVSCVEPQVAEAEPAEAVAVATAAVPAAAAPASGAKAPEKK